MPGRKQRCPPEIHVLCLELSASRGWSYPKIAEYLSKHKGIKNEYDPERPVDRSTIMRWIRNGKEHLSKEKRFRADVEGMVAGLELDRLKELTYELFEDDRTESVDARIKVVRVALELNQERRKLWGLDAPKRKEVAHTGDIELRGLDLETSLMLEALENQVEENRSRRGDSQSRDDRWS